MFDTMLLLNGGEGHIELHKIQDGHVRKVVELYSKSVSGRSVKASRNAIGTVKKNPKKRGGT